MKLSADIINFFKKQGVIIVSTLDENGDIHCAAKGLVAIRQDGLVHLIDLYTHRTYHNLKRDPKISLTAIDEKHFVGYTLQGTAKIYSDSEISKHALKKWENKIIERISNRVISGVQSGTKSDSHFEMELPPHPKHVIEVRVKKIIELRPPNLT